MATKACKVAGNIPPTTSSSDLFIITSSRALVIFLIFKQTLCTNKRAFRKNKVKHINTKINISSFYYLCKVQEYKTFIEFSHDFINSLDKNAINIIGQDSNTEIGISNHNNKLPDYSIGKYGKDRRNRKSCNLLHMV